MHTKYFSFIKNRFPQLPESSAELISDKLISPFTVQLPKDVLGQAKLVVKQLYSLRERPEYIQSVYSKSHVGGQFDPGNKSICMSYDFHMDSTGTLKLIEVNTNAAFLLMGYLLYGCKGEPLPIADFSLGELRENWLSEAQLNGNNLSSIAIVDEAPSSQRLFIEFLCYEQLFKEFGYDVSIADPSELAFRDEQLQAACHKIDFVYNRTTDFYFENPTLQALKEAYLAKKVTVSPNPHEYALLADKQRLIEWSLALREANYQTETLLPIQKNLLETVYLSESNSSQIWSKKKKYFFKPLTSFGSKGSYRGEGISRVHFDQLIDKQCLAQEFCPPPDQLFTAPGVEPTKLKYDLRFFTYKDRVQMVIARLYQGQVTNLRTPLGGFAPVVFT